MAPNQAEYEQFLQAAVERLTVGTLHLVAADADADAGSDLYPGFQKAPCENKFRAIANAFLASKAIIYTPPPIPVGLRLFQKVRSDSGRTNWNPVESSGFRSD